MTTKTSKTQTREKRTMTAEQATQFETHSLTNTQICALASALRGCECEAYRDYYTFNRWLAQGQAVKKGEKGTAITLIKSAKKTDPKTGEEKTVTYPSSTTVFCRCQVAPIQPKTA